MIIELPRAEINGERVSFGKLTGAPDLAKNARNKLSSSDFKSIIERHSSGDSQASIARDYSVSTTHIGNIINGNYKRARVCTTRLTDGDILQIRRLRGQYKRIELAEMFGVSTSYISDILNRKVRLIK